MQVQQSSATTDNHLMHSERPVEGWVWTPGLKYVENTKSQSMPLQTAQHTQPTIHLVQLPG